LSNEYALGFLRYATRIQPADASPSGRRSGSIVRDRANDPKGPAADGDLISRNSD
jgi:hypothetical protein